MKQAASFTEKVLTLMLKEWKVEWRNRYALNGLLLYLISTIFICYMSFNVKVNQLNPLTWNALFWIIMLFAAVNAIAKSFMHEKPGHLLYYYTLFSPQTLIIARLLYNALLMLVLALSGSWAACISFSTQGWQRMAPWPKIISERVMMLAPSTVIEIGAACQPRPR